MRDCNHAPVLLFLLLTILYQITMSSKADLTSQSSLFSLLAKNGSANSTFQPVSPGAPFFSEVGRASIVGTEFDDPFPGIVLYDLHEVDVRPLDVSEIPPEAWPYPDCLFNVLSEKDNASRFTRLKDFFLVLGQPGDPSESVGLMYTVMHLWKFFYGTAMVTPTPQVTATVTFFMEAGIFKCSMKILGRYSDKKFLLMDYNRLVPYRLLELIFAATQMSGAEDLKAEVVRSVLAEPGKAFNVFHSLISGRLSCVEELMACQLVANFTSYEAGMDWLLNYPWLVGRVGMHLWSTYDILFQSTEQYSELNTPYITHLDSAEIEVLRDVAPYKNTHLAVADLCTYVILGGLSNMCAACPAEQPMSRVGPCLLAMVREGLFTHAGTVIYGIILNDNKYYQKLTVEKFLLVLSWSCFQPETQRLAVEQLNSLPTHRDDVPLYYDRDSFSKSRSVIACLLTHACHLDYEKGSHLALLALVYLLKESEDVAKEVVRVAGDTLFDMAHSLHEAKPPDPSQKPIPFQKVVLETMLSLSGCDYLGEGGERVKASGKMSAIDPLPSCLEEARVFCDVYVKQKSMDMSELQKMVRCADDFKAEGNKFFLKKNYHSAIECYTRALAVCPLVCTERRVTYYSNRAECYLKTDQSHRAVRDCNKALAQNHTHLRTRWRRAQAFQNIQKQFPAALDLLTIRRHEEEAKKTLGDRLYADLDQMIYDLMDGGRYQAMAEKTAGPQVHGGSVEREGALNREQKENRLKLPPYRGRYFHEIFNDGRWGYR